MPSAPCICGKAPCPQNGNKHAVYCSDACRDAHTWTVVQRMVASMPGSLSSSFGVGYRLPRKRVAA